MNDAIFLKFYASQPAFTFQMQIKFKGSQSVLGINN